LRLVYEPGGGHKLSGGGTTGQQGCKQSKGLCFSPAWLMTLFRYAGDITKPVPGLFSSACLYSADRFRETGRCVQLRLSAPAHQPVRDKKIFALNKICVGFLLHWPIEIQIIAPK